MDMSLDFVTRARNAWRELRHPEAQENPHAQLETASHLEEGSQPRRSSQYPVAPMDPSAAVTEFRLLVGIYQDKSFAPPRGWVMNRRPQASVRHRPAPNLGIYTTVCEKEITAKRNYKSFSRLVNCCLGLQLVVAAALTSLGAANGSGGAVTALGAINTVIAGFLTYLKGSGLPNRLKYFQHEWARVREYIEQKERDFMFGIPGMNVRDEVEAVRRMYEAVKQDVQTNTPERFVSSTQVSAAMHAPPPPVARPQPSFSAESSNGGRYFNEKETEANTALNRASGTGNSLFSKLGHLKDVMEDKVKEIGHMEKEIEASGHRTLDDGKRGLDEKHEQLHSNLKDVAYLGKEIESGARAAAMQSSDAARDGFAAGRDYTHNTVAQYTNTATDALQARRDAADAAIGQSSAAASSAIAGQRDAAHTALYGHEPPPPAS